MAIPQPPTLIPCTGPPTSVQQQSIHVGNAPIYTANKVYAWFNNNSIRRLIGWPPNSPDLNPIKHM